VLPDGAPLPPPPAQYLVKYAIEDAGRVMMEGELNSMTELYKTNADKWFRSLAGSENASIERPEDTYFFLSLSSSI
jgi:hypothetical protein